MGLIEVLIAVLILSIGLLGIAFVQTRSLSSNNSSMAQSMAVVATYSILDAMRADRAGATTGTYNGEVIGNSCGTVSNSLKSVQVVAWCEELAARLGAAATTKGRVSCDGSGECVITVIFDDSRIGAGGNASRQIVTRAAL